MHHEYNILQKQIRAKVIKTHLEVLLERSELDCVCFTCGNASKYLIKEGLNVTEVIKPKVWWSYNEIARYFKQFDATSGHLPFPLMVDIANELKAQVEHITNGFKLPAGSGETFVCLSMAFPDKLIHPVYGVDESTKYNEWAPLNSLVSALYKGRLNKK